MHGTTILAIRKGNETVLAADGQVSIQHTIEKANTNKLRKLNDGKVLAGFAGSTADAFLLFDLFEKKLKTFNGQLVRAAVELAKDWRSDKMLRRLEAQLLTADSERILLISGSGDVLEPDFDVHAIGSGGAYALAAGRALLDTSDLDAKAIAEKSMHIAADICIYTNHQVVFETL